MENNINKQSIEGLAVTAIPFYEEKTTDNNNIENEITSNVNTNLEEASKTAIARKKAAVLTKDPFSTMLLAIGDSLLKLTGSSFVTIDKKEAYYNDTKACNTIDTTNKENIDKIGLNKNDTALLKPLMTKVVAKRVGRLTPERQLLAAVMTIMASKAQAVIQIKKDNKILEEKIIKIIQQKYEEEIALQEQENSLADITIHLDDESTIPVENETVLAITKEDILNDISETSINNTTDITNTPAVNTALTPKEKSISDAIETKEIENSIKDSDGDVTDKESKKAVNSVLKAKSEEGADIKSTDYLEDTPSKINLSSSDVVTKADNSPVTVNDDDSHNPSEIVSSKTNIPPEEKDAITSESNSGD